MPDSVRADIESEGFILHHLEAADPPIEAAHVFVRSSTELDEAIGRLRPRLAPAGFLWVSWPKKASGVATDVDEDRIRAAAFPLGLVDVKVCAIDTTWSGLKLTIRPRLR